MSDIAKPAIPIDHPDRILKCQEAMHVAFMGLVAEALAAGWNERDVLVAITDLADNHMLMHMANDESEAALAQFFKRP
ncbi:hypothetical protein ELI41_29680 (plasmid) [Rhizobium leguminosarum]|uniref:hypothetical protein n=1 Tax=Rhizobium leguminosarum TaxID=384 RepID=UPI00102FF00F|nr:hypothetical protein [Rhizobium leguminosarum]TAU80478.1 hypothetical protein ELI41_29680 [Rhizobium leguminosarum]